MRSENSKNKNWYDGESQGQCSCYSLHTRKQTYPHKHRCTHTHSLTQKQSPSHSHALSVSHTQIHIHSLSDIMAHLMHQSLRLHFQIFHFILAIQIFHGALCGVHWRRDTSIVGRKVVWGDRCNSNLAKWSRKRTAKEESGKEERRRREG